MVNQFGDVAVGAQNGSTPDNELSVSEQLFKSAHENQARIIDVGYTGRATSYTIQSIESDPSYVNPQGDVHAAAVAGAGTDKLGFYNVYANESDQLTQGINDQVKKFIDEPTNEYQGNPERNIVRRDISAITALREGLANHSIPDAEGNKQLQIAYRLLIMQSTAAGESFMRRGSQVPHMESEHPAYVLTSSSYYDLRSLALDDLYSARVAIKLDEKIPGVDTSGLDNTRKRIDVDVKKIVDTPHDMKAILNEMAGPVYQKYADRFDSWKDTITHKYALADNYVPALGTKMTNQYKAKQQRDIALLDMALLKNHADDQQALTNEVQNSLSTAKNLDPNNPDLIQLNNIWSRMETGQ